ncbi:MAG: hypothetical protein QOJ99_3083 [Bryobacterales bacterium]|nr:hypothetical protein [Bryobacterales bacterium]
MFETAFRCAGRANASSTATKIAMKTPFLIFLVSGFATLQLEPLASRGAELLSRVVREQMHSLAIPRPVAQAGANKIDCLREELADVQIDLMKVLETDRTLTTHLESREADLKYAVRAEQVRRDEIAQCRKAGKTGANRLLADVRCELPASEKPQS